MAAGAALAVLPMMVPKKTRMLLLLLLLLLQGSLAEGGLIFVLKSGSTGQNTKWLKVSCSAVAA
jgi:hypothetical protein